MGSYSVRSIGHVSSTLTDLDAAPRQGDEDAPAAWLVLDDDVRGAAADVRAGDRLVLLTFLDRADRTVLAVHPRGDTANPVTGVFSTRSPHRPNPIGLHDVVVIDVQADRIRVDGLEAIDGTPILDIKPALEAPGKR